MKQEDIENIRELTAIIKKAIDDARADGLPDIDNAIMTAEFIVMAGYRKA